MSESTSTQLLVFCETFSITDCKVLALFSAYSNDAEITSSDRVALAHNALICESWSIQQVRLPLSMSSSLSVGSGSVSPSNTADTRISGIKLFKPPATCKYQVNQIIIVEQSTFGGGATPSMPI